MSNSRIKYEKFIKRYINVASPMRDGVSLRSDIYLPEGEGPFPAVLLRTPYLKCQATSPRYHEWAIRYAENGFACAIQDVRGRGDSDGEWYPFLNEGPDEHDMVEWIAEQHWCDGNVGIDGNSYLSHTGHTALKEQPKHLKAVALSGSLGDLMRSGTVYMHGVKNFYMASWLQMVNGHNLQTPMDAYSIDGNKFDKRNLMETAMTLPLSKLTDELGYESQYWLDTLENEMDSDFWASPRLTGNIKNNKIASLHSTGWFDANLIGTMEYYEEIKSNSVDESDHYLIIGPWPHNEIVAPKQEVFGIDFGEESVIDMQGEKIKFFGKYLRDEENEIANTRVYDMGNRSWNASESFVKGEKVDYYLNSGEAEKEQNYSSEYDEFVYNPLNPTPSSTLISPANATPIFAGRKDILIYEIEGTDDLKLDGNIELELYISSDCVDTEFHALITDCDSEGKALPLGYSGIRASRRNGTDKKEMLTPDEVTKISFTLPYIRNTFKAGNKMQIIISSCSFPLFARCLNTDEDVYNATTIKSAVNRIYHTEKYASKAILPIK